MSSGERPNWTNVGEASTCLRRAATGTTRAFNFKTVLKTGRADFRRFGTFGFAGRIFSETLFSASQNCRHDSRIAASVHGGENPQWSFLRRVGDQIIAR